MARLIALMRQAVNIFISNVYGKVYVGTCMRRLREL